MAQLSSKSFDEPDEVLELPFLSSKIVVLGEVHVAWSTSSRWSARGAASTITSASS